MTHRSNDDESLCDVARVLTQLGNKPPNVSLGVIAVCAYCNSTEVLADAFAKWNVDTQKWEVESTFDKGATCAQCEESGRSDHRIEMIELESFLYV